MDLITLNNGVTIPQVGLGTYLLEPDDAQSAVTYALDNGYTLIDTANVYVNERAVGRGMRASSKAREEIFLETKPWPSFLEKAHKEGKIRAIGLSNFDVAQTQHILDECEVVPAINQVECHPYFPQTELKVLLAQHNIALQAWYPLGGRGNDSIMSEPLVQGLAEKYGKSPAQLLLRWHIQQEHIVIPGSKTPSHIAQNIDLFDFALTDEDMAQIDSLDKGKPFSEHNDEVLARFLAYVPDVEGQK